MLEQTTIAIAEETVKQSSIDTVKNVVVDVVKQHPVVSGVVLGVVGALTITWAGRKLFGNKKG